MKLLHVDSSILGPGSVSRSLSADVVAAFAAKHPTIAVTYRDLVSAPIDHLTAAHLAVMNGAVPTDASLSADIGAGNTAMEEFLDADIIVVGAPMYNFGIPSQLKAWIDRLAVAGKTFRYTSNGPEGLAGAKKVVIVSSRGGFFGPGSSAAAFDHQETYLQALFGFLGVRDLSFIRAEGVATGPDGRKKAISSAKDEVSKLAA
ncbi:FMN-dependent NADH-azoreductase [Mesorhizobium sp. B2-1-8]|uniref:FMN-dependent NADH-azoreductase n=1 Tax=Mesorhizobium sp. B2-1-8 TaxID=2589967 RepID=UPI00112AC506|nr:FMN-dependent NADH-azoreductase [Mesorhizobium sp. B2-1-8]UCI22322.1 FMN-dependent NADH-azoreductase [Mesorhizobium sp. B2-1-8]